MVATLLIGSQSAQAWTTRLSSSMPTKGEGRIIDSITASRPINHLASFSHPSSSTQLHAAVKQARQSTKSKTESPDQSSDDLPAGIGGAEFFGGNKEKEEFYDATAEAQASVGVVQKKEESISDDDNETIATTSFDRFAQRTAFTSELSAKTARQWQTIMNQVLYDEEGIETKEQDRPLSYASKLTWNSPFSNKASTPVQALQQTLEKYRRVDFAVTSATEKTDESNAFELTWELSLGWPTFWEPKVLITGTSKIALNDKNQITQQFDTVLGGESLNNLITDQVTPRFWDLYHIGMTPPAETSPLLPTRHRNVVQLPGRWSVSPTLRDADRSTASGAVPFHAFNTVIKTVGPTKQRFVPTSPLEIQIEASTKRVTWHVPLAVEFQSQLSWPAAMVSDEEDFADAPTCSYTWNPPRTIMMQSYPQGGPQDEGIPAARKRLYEQVMQQDGVEPKLVEDRPVFSFWKEAFKGCFTEEGFGMAVYEWRPGFAAGNFIAMEVVTKD